MSGFSTAFGSRFLRERNVWLWPGAILALWVPAAEPADPVLTASTRRFIFHAQ
jgi:hypothetical protein